MQRARRIAGGVGHPRAETAQPARLAARWEERERDAGEKGPRAGPPSAVRPTFRGLVYPGNRSPILAERPAWSAAISASCFPPGQNAPAAPSRPNSAGSPSTDPPRYRPNTQDLIVPERFQRVHRYRHHRQGLPFRPRDLRRVPLVSIWGEMALHQAHRIPAARTVPCPWPAHRQSGRLARCACRIEFTSFREQPAASACSPPRLAATRLPSPAPRGPYPGRSCLSSLGSWVHGFMVALAAATPNRPQGRAGSQRPHTVEDPTAGRNSTTPAAVACART